MTARSYLKYLLRETIPRPFVVADAVSGGLSVVGGLFAYLYPDRLGKVGGMVWQISLAVFLFLAFIRFCRAPYVLQRHLSTRLDDLEDRQKPRFEFFFDLHIPDCSHQIPGQLYLLRVGLRNTGIDSISGASVSIRSMTSMPGTLPLGPPANQLPGAKLIFRHQPELQAVQVNNGPGVFLDWSSGRITGPD